MRSVSHLGYFSKTHGQRSNQFPAGVLVGAALLLSFAVGAVIFGQQTGIGVIKRETSVPLAIRDVVISRTAEDMLIVEDARNGTRIEVFGQDEGGFVRGSLRAFERMRRVAQVPEAAPYRIIKWQGGRVSLSDTATGERFYLEAFGKDNAAAFAALLATPRGGSQ